MLQKTVLVWALVGAVAAVLLLPKPASANHVLRCTPYTGAYADNQYEPPRFKIYSSTRCTIRNNPFDLAPDAMWIDTSWEYYRWGPPNRGWNYGGGYRQVSCGYGYCRDVCRNYVCLQELPPGTGVRHPRYLGINCKRGRNVHGVWPHLTQGKESIAYFYLTSNHVCH